MPVRPCPLALAAVLCLPMTAIAATITGTAAYADRSALPPDATFEVTVEDVSLADAPAGVIGRLAFMPAGQVPIRFEVPYDASAVKERHSYSVRATIRRDGRLLYTTTQIYPVLTRGAGNAVEVELRKVGAPATTSSLGSPDAPDRPLANTYWKLTELRGAQVEVAPNQREPHVILQVPERRVVGSGGCNRLVGAYADANGVLEFKGLTTTRMACPEGMAQEGEILKALGEVRGYAVKGDTLSLLDAGGASVLRAIAVDLR